MNHASYPDDYLRSILAETRTVAVVGASPKPERPSYSVLRYLLGRGYSCVPVNPGQAGGSILGQEVFGHLSDIPHRVDMVDVFRNSDAAGRVVDEVLALPSRPKVIWMQLGVYDAAAAKRAEAEGLKVVLDRCPAIEIPRLRVPPHGSPVPTR